MMKWKVVKNPRCVSAERSLECLRNKDPPTYGRDSNNNNQCKQETNAQNENNKQQDSGFIRKPSLVASDCINLKSFLGLTRQRSEMNLSNLGLTSNEPRRSRSEVRGISCDRLTIGYHTPSIGVTKTTPPSPPSKGSCWLRGRKKERDVRSPPKVNAEPCGKTIVTSSRRSNSKPCETRTIADQSGGLVSKNTPPKLSSSEVRKIKSNKKNNSENIIEEDIYVEIGHVNTTATVKESLVKAKAPTKANRKKGQAPKPQVASVLLKESNCDVNLNPNGINANETTNYFIEKKTSPLIKPARKSQAICGKNEDKHFDNRTTPTVKLNNLKNSETFLTVKNKITTDSNIQIAVAEIHKHTVNDSAVEEKNNSENFDDDKVTENTNKLEELNYNIKATNHLKDEELTDEKERIEEKKIEIPPYRIDTPDYSTLESIVENNQNNSSPSKQISVNNLKNTTSSTADIANCSILNYTPAETDKHVLENTISSILRDSSNEIELTPKKVVRFEKIDLIETYKKNKSETVKDSDEESVTSKSEKKPPLEKVLDVNSNEIISPETEKNRVESPEISDSGIVEKFTSASSDCFSESSVTSSTESECPQKAMTVNVLVRNPSPECTESPTDEAHTQLVVKKSFVLTVAKQEKGFQSLYANKKPEVCIELPKSDHKISVTFLCSDSIPEAVKSEPPVSALRLRSISVPPQILQKPEAVPVLPIMRGRSRERRSKDRQHCKKSHKSKKKDASFHMPQAVIDELSQVLEKRKPSLDKKSAPRSS